MKLSEDKAEDFSCRGMKMNSKAKTLIGKDQVTQKCKALQTLFSSLSIVTLERKDSRSK
jgi:hypothetical protein